MTEPVMRIDRARALAGAIELCAGRMRIIIDAAEAGLRDLDDDEIARVLALRRDLAADILAPAAQPHRQGGEPC